MRSVMKTLIVVLVLCFLAKPVIAQDTPEETLRYRRIEFYRTLSSNGAIGSFLDDSLSYGHSNGWVESRTEFQHNLGKKLVYHSINETDLKISVHGPVAHVRFNGEFDVSLDGNRNTYKLSVLEVWVLRKTEWKIFARQAVKRP